MDLVTSLDDLIRAQEHLLRVKSILKNNRYESYLYDPIGHIESELDRQIKIARRREVQDFGEREPFTPVVQEKETPKAPIPTEKFPRDLQILTEDKRLYDVLEEQTNGFFAPDSSYSSLSRAEATQKYEFLLSEGVSPENIKIVRVK
tara:strand:+ start:307 stop:747 length:441 start_codon:yes stop_codon:yes gene_type:complete